MQKNSWINSDVFRSLKKIVSKNPDITFEEAKKLVDHLTKQDYEEFMERHASLLLVQLANSLDNKGLHSCADLVDKIAGDWYGSKPIELETVKAKPTFADYLKGLNGLQTNSYVNPNLVKKIRIAKEVLNKIGVDDKVFAQFHAEIETMIQEDIKMFIRNIELEIDELSEEAKRLEDDEDVRTIKEIEKEIKIKLGVIDYLKRKSDELYRTKVFVGIPKTLTNVSNVSPESAKGKLIGVFNWITNLISKGEGSGKYIPPAGHISKAPKREKITTLPGGEKSPMFSKGTPPTPAGGPQYPRN